MASKPVISNIPVSLLRKRKAVLASGLCSSDTIRSAEIGRERGRENEI